MNEQIENNPRGVVTGIMITLFAVIVSTVLFGSFFTAAYVKKMAYGNLQAMVLQLTSIVVAIGITQFLSRMIQGNKLSMMQGFLGGWMASLVLAIFICSFYTIFSNITGTQLLPKGAFAKVLMLYSGIGIIISLILAVIFKKD